MSVPDVFAGRRRWGLAVGDCSDSLRGMPANSVHCCVTSPPYYGLRSYLPADHPDKAKEIGMEETPEAYIERMVGVFREVRRVLRDDAVMWVNIGDSYAAGGKSGGGKQGERWKECGADTTGPRGGKWSPAPRGYKSKDRIGIPHMLAFALRADGWYFRDEIIWAKRNPMPSSTQDRTTAAHEFVFMFSKKARYYYDGLAIAEKSVTKDNRRPYTSNGAKQLDGREVWKSGQPRDGEDFSTRNKRSVWPLSTKPYKGSHYATFPPKLVEPCILAGTSAAGCCPVCGSPWVRVVERTVVRRVRPNQFTKYRTVNGQPDQTKQGVHTATTGWAAVCGCGTGLLPDDLEIIDTPTGERTAEDPSAVVGRAGFSRPRGDGEGRRPITRYEQRKYAYQIKASAYRSSMAEQAGPAIAHYLRTDRSGARPIPPDLLGRWIDAGWLTPVSMPPAGEPTRPVPCVVLDPFAGSGTTLMVANEHGRRAVGCDLDERNTPLVRQRMELVQPLIGFDSTTT